MKKIIGMTVCAALAVFLAWLSIDSGEWYWLYLIIAALLGVAAGVIKNLPDSRA